mgnify:CR=1 FL=1
MMTERGKIRGVVVGFFFFEVREILILTGIPFGFTYTHAEEQGDVNIKNQKQRESSTGGKRGVNRWRNKDK